MKSKRLIVFTSALLGLSFLTIYLNSSVFSTFIDKIYNSDFLFPFSLFQGLLNSSTRNDWVFTGVIPIFPDLLFGYIFWILTRNMNIVLIAYAIFQPLLLLASFIYLSKQVFGRNHIVISLLILASTIPILLVATGQYWGLYFILIWYQHCGLISLEIIALGLVIKLLINPPQGLILPAIHYFLLGVLIILGTTTDPLFFLQFTIPAILAVILFIFISACPRKNAALVGLSIIISSIVGFLIYNFPAIWGSTRLALFGNYAKLLVTSIPNNFSVVLSQLSSIWSPHLWMVILWGLFYLVCIVITIRFSRTWLSRKIGHTRRRILLLSIFFPLQLIILIGATTITGSNSRWYFLPLVFIPLFWGWPFFIPLMTKWKAIVRNNRFVLFSEIAISLSACLLVFSIAFRNNSLQEISAYYPSWVACIDSNAQKYHLHHGIADYWRARTLTLLTKAGYSVVQVSPTLMPFRWENASNEYQGNDFDFVIIDPSAGLDYEIKVATIVDRFGEPSASFSCEGKNVLVYNQPKDNKFREQFTPVNSSTDLEKVGNKLFYYASQLPSHVGTISGDGRIAEESTSTPGFLTFGPYTNIPEGEYQFTIEYDGQSIDNSRIGAWDVSLKEISQTTELLKGDILSGGNSIVGSFRTPVRGNIEIRVYYNGIGTLEVTTLMIERID